MKLAPLLAQFLYSNKRLDLPGIGSFIVDGSPQTGNTETQAAPADISFVNNPSVQEAPELVQYISSQTGKIKPLAAADLDSHLNVVRQFLNIGKPFLLEGIGSLVKIRGGEFAFSAGEVLPEKLKSFTAKEISATSSTEESFTNYQKGINAGSGKFHWGKPALLLLILAGVGLAIWGGYTVYKNTTSKNRTAKKEAPVQKEETQLLDDTDSENADSIPGNTSTQINNSASGFRFILETANAKRAFERYGRLKTFQWNVQMETKDSQSYKLYLTLPVAAADTSRIIDSLTRLNGRKVYVEQ